MSRLLLGFRAAVVSGPPGHGRRRERSGKAAGQTPVTYVRPRWTPATYAEAEADVHAGRVQETHHLEAKQLIEDGPREAHKIGKALGAFSTDRGTLVVGVAQNPNGVPDRITPVVLNGLPERIAQLAMESPR